MDSLHKPTEAEQEVEAMAMKLTNNTITMAGGKQAGNHVLGKHHPSGTIRVYNTVTGQYEPLRNMKVFVRYWFWEDDATTDNNGYFYIKERYSHEVGLYATFRSTSATICKGFNEWIGLWVSEKIANQKGSNQQQWISPQSDNRLWRKASVHNAVEIYKNYAAQNGIKQPHNVRIWLKENTGGSVTVMLHNKNVANYYFGNDHLGGHTWLSLGYRAPIAVIDFLKVPDKFKPDIIFGWEDFTHTHTIYETVFHELAHYSHFYKAGEFSYWRPVANHMSDTGNNDGYGKGNETYAGYVALTEAWAFHIGFNLADEVLNHPQNLNPQPQFGGRPDFNYVLLEEDFRPYSVPVNPESSVQKDRWIPAGLLYDLGDNTPNETVTLWNANLQAVASAPDNVQGITNAMLYQCLSPEVTNIPALREKIKNKYPAVNVTNLTNLFRAYGY